MYRQTCTHSLTKPGSTMPSGYSNGQRQTNSDRGDCPETDNSPIFVLAFPWNIGCWMVNRRFFSQRRNATTTNQNRWSNTEQFELVDGWKLEFRVQPPPAGLVLQVDVSHWTLTTKMGRIHERWTEHVIWGMKNAISDFLWRHSVTWINQIEYNSSHQVPVTNTPLRLLALGSHAHQIHRAPHCSSWHALVLSTAKPGTDAQNSIISIIPLAERRTMVQPAEKVSFRNKAMLIHFGPIHSYTLLCTWVRSLCMFVYV